MIKYIFKYTVIRNNIFIILVDDVSNNKGTLSPVTESSSHLQDELLKDDNTDNQSLKATPRMSTSTGLKKDESKKKRF